MQSSSCHRHVSRVRCLHVSPDARTRIRDVVVTICTSINLLVDAAVVPLYLPMFALPVSSTQL